MGDESTTIPFEHGNSKNSKSPFIRTLPSYLNSMRKLSKETKPSILYKNEVATVLNWIDDKTQSVILAPRNMKQLQNLRHKSLHNKRLSRDDLLNIHQMDYNLNGYIMKIVTYPDLEVVFGLREVVSELENMLALADTGQLLSYDTTFNLGDFYLSCLIFHHTAFTKNPCIPCLYFLHERKFTATHKIFFDELKRNIPSLNAGSVTIVTDQEKAIVNAISSELPQVNVVHCWNHILQDVIPTGG